MQHHTGNTDKTADEVQVMLYILYISTFPKMSASSIFINSNEGEIT